MHPVIKIVCLLAMAGLLIHAEPLRVIVTSSLLLLLLLFYGRSYWLDVWRMAWRLKWFLLSIIFFYGWFIPDTSIIQSDSNFERYLPSYEGMLLALNRIAVLLNIVVAVVLLVRTSHREELMMAIMWLIRPLSILGLNTQIFALRLMLTMEHASNMKAVIGQRVKQFQPRSNPLQAGIDLVANQLMAIEARSSDEGEVQVDFPEVTRPHWWQWLIPVIVVIGLMNLQ